MSFSSLDTSSSHYIRMECEVMSLRIGCVYLNNKKESDDFEEYYELKLDFVAVWLPFHFHCSPLLEIVWGICLFTNYICWWILGLWVPQIWNFICNLLGLCLWFLLLHLGYCHLSQHRAAYVQSDTWLNFFVSIFFHKYLVSFLHLNWNNFGFQRI